MFTFRKPRRCHASAKSLCNCLLLGLLFAFGCSELESTDVAAANNASLTGAAPQQGVPQARKLISEGKFAEAETVLAQLVEQNPGSAVGWMLLGYSRHAQGKLDKALEAHLKAATFPQVQASGFYNAACVYSRKDEPEKAMEYLQKAVTAGFADPTLLATDSDLDNVRDQEGFDQLLPKLLTGDELFAEPTAILQTLVGERTKDEFGWVARQIGDVDEDGVIDFVTTAPSFSNNSGKVYVYSSREGKLLFTRVGQGNQRLGNGAAGAGDVNGDGTPDVIVGGPLNGGGLAEVLSGKDGSLLWQVRGEQGGGRFGYKVCGMGDLNGDGRADFAVTALAADGKEKGSGSCFVYSGKNGEVMFELEGEHSGDKFGSAVVGSEDMDHPMLVVGAQDAGTGKRGKVYVYKFTDANTDKVQVEHAFTIDADTDGRDLGQMFLSFPGDLNQDGVPDFFCSDFTDSAGGQGAGRFFVYSGADGEKLLDVKGTQPGEGLGTSISNAGDANGDGIGDLIVGAWQNKNGAPSGGKVYLYSGADGELLTAWTCQQAGDTFGFDAQGIGDVNGDGRVDFLLTSAWSPARGPKTGRVLIIAGPELSEEE